MTPTAPRDRAERRPGCIGGRQQQVSGPGTDVVSALTASVVLCNSAGCWVPLGASPESEQQGSALRAHAKDVQKLPCVARVLSTQPAPSPLAAPLSSAHPWRHPSLSRPQNAPAPTSRCTHPTDPVPAPHRAPDRADRPPRTRRAQPSGSLKSCPVPSPWAVFPSVIS